MAQNIFDQVAQEEAAKVASSNQTAQPATQPVTSNAPASPATQAPAAGGNIFDQVAQEEVTKQSQQQQQQQQTQTNAVPTDDYLAKTENAIHHGAEFVGDVYNEVGQMAEGFKNLGDQIFGYKASDNAKNLMTKGWHSLVDGNGNEARANIRDAVNDYVVNHPLAKMAEEQWNSSMVNRQKAIEAGKKGHVMDTAQHVAGVLPMVNVASDAIDKAKAEPSIQNYAHASVALAAAMSAYYGMVRGVVPSEAAVEDVAPETLAQRQAAMDARATTTPTHAFDPESGTVTPVEQAVTKGVKKSGLIDEGTPAEFAMSEAKRIQTVDVSQGLRNSLNQVAEQEGLQPVTSKSVRDIGKDLGDQFYARSKEMFSKVQETTGVDLNGLQQDIKTLQEKIADDAGEDPERIGKLIEKVNAKQDIADKAFEHAKEAGLDVEKARTDWKKFNAAYDLGNHIRMATTGRAGMGATGIETVDPVKMSGRLHKLYDSNSPTQPGRLQQLMGNSEASDLLNHVESARNANQIIMEHVPESATGRNALAELVRRNTAGKSTMLGKNVGVTDWNGVVKDFENLSREQQDTMFRDTDGQGVTKLRQYLGRQAAKQNALEFLKGKTLGGKIFYGVGAPLTEEAVRRSLQ